MTSPAPLAIDVRGLRKSFGPRAVVQGLDLRVSQSGQRRGHFGLSKHGDAELRRLLYLAALSAGNSTRDDTFVKRYQREQAKGLTKPAALNAVARKLAKVAWSIVTHGTTYDPKRVDCQPVEDEPLDRQPENLRSARKLAQLALSSSNGVGMKGSVHRSSLALRSRSLS